MHKLHLHVKRGSFCWGTVPPCTLMGFLKHHGLLACNACEWRVYIAGGEFAIFVTGIDARKFHPICFVFAVGGLDDC